MKAIFIFASLIITTSLLAAFPDMRINGFSGTFSSLQGTGNATHFVFSKEHQEPQRAKVKMEFSNSDLSFDVDGKKYVMTLFENVITSKDKYIWRDVNLLAGGRAINASAERLYAEYSGFEGNAEELAISCTGKQTSTAPWIEQLLDFCTTDSQVVVEKVTYESLKDNNELASALANIFEEVFPEGINDAVEGSLGAKDIDVTVRNHSLKVKGQVKFGVYMSVSAKGDIRYMPHTKSVRVRLDKVTAVFINVTDKVFSEIEKMNSDKIRVDRPYIYLNLL